MDTGNRLTQKGLWLTQTAPRPAKALRAQTRTPNSDYSEIARSTNTTINTITTRCIDLAQFYTPVAYKSKQIPCKNQFN
jgi:hypothetical protein